jgi:F420-0:gamma-glutamyl ligase-like protein
MAQGRSLALPVETRYWLPGTNLDEVLLHHVATRIRDGDVVVFSEKALSTAQGNIMDENKILPGISARLLAMVWMRVVWGYLLGPLCRMRRKSLERIRRYPIEAAAHKQLVLAFSGPLQALRHGSEGGVDVSNLPLSYACLPLKDPSADAHAIHRSLLRLTGKSVKVMIVDTDKTYSFLSFHFTPRPRPISGITCLGLLAYVIGRSLNLRKRATPLAVSGNGMSVETALNIAELADRARGHGAGRTAWEMAERFRVGLTGVTWGMLMGLKHYPIVIVRGAG